MFLLAKKYSLAIVALVAFVAHNDVEATVHTLCYNYFMQKDGCVFSANDPSKRCAPDGHPPKRGVSMLKPAGQTQQRRDLHSLERRYDTPSGSRSFFIGDANGGGVSIYNLFKSSQPGACLWAGGRDAQGNPTGGWVASFKQSNCGKQLYLMRKGRPDTVQYIPVVDGCDFGITSPDTGCFQIAVTEKTFWDMNPTEQEQKQGYLTELTWDFNNLDGSNSRNGPV
ncbi:secreted protein [Melampsora americana]|nr:secreted protein [Melampsora americana]